MYQKHLKAFLLCICYYGIDRIMGVSFLIVYEISQKTKMDSYIILNSGYRMPILGLG